MRASVETYSLKELEVFYGFQRMTPLIVLLAETLSEALPDAYCSMSLIASKALAIWMLVTARETKRSKITSQPASIDRCILNFSRRLSLGVRRPEFDWRYSPDYPMSACLRAVG